MKEYRQPLFDVLEQTPSINSECAAYSGEEARNTLRFHRTIPAYEATPLVSLKDAATKYGVSDILVKDESFRFGLKAFKGLGGTYCMFRILCERLSLDPETADFRTFMDEEIRRECSEIEFVTATDGNHGKGVSWAAKIFGCKAHVFMPKGTVEARRQAIESAGSATAEITDMNYDNTVSYAARLAREKGWILIQDTSWEGYDRYPRWIIQGYLTLAAEATEQMGDKVPTHIFLQAGVGSMAGGIEAYFLNRFADSLPLVTIVEPRAADCIYRSARACDGMPHSVEGDPVTIMAGLNCGTPCKLIWPVLRDCSAYFCACDDRITELGMREYAHPVGQDKKIISGESGAVTFGLTLSILKDEETRKMFHINQESVILLINTEGDTDPEGYARVVSHKEESQMDIKEAILARHSVRQYKDTPIPEDLRERLEELVGECNAKSGLHMQLVLDDPECFDTFLAHYGKFRNARNYIALVGEKSLPDLEELCGYYGQKMVLEAQMMGLNTCWVAGTYGKGKCKAEKADGEKLVCVIAIGYGETQGKKRRTKSMEKLCSVPREEMPVWFRNGVKAAMMAPTAVNQQKFRIDLEEDQAVITAGRGPMTKIDLGIVKYNFEAASGHKVR